MCHFYSELELNKIGAQILKDIPHADKSGFFELNDECYGTIAGWSKELSISVKALIPRLKDKKSIKGKSRIKRTYDFYSESVVREACVDLLQFLPQADQDGIYEKDGEKYATPWKWSKILQISENSIVDRLKKENVIGIKIRDKIGRIRMFYSESYIRSLCADVLEKLPQADESDFILKDGKRYATIGRWSKILRISNRNLKIRLNEMNESGIKGKTKSGNIHDFYPEPAVREACADLLDKKSNPKRS